MFLLYSRESDTTVTFYSDYYILVKAELLLQLRIIVRARFISNILMQIILMQMFLVIQKEAMYCSAKTVCHSVKVMCHLWVKGVMSFCCISRVACLKATV